MLIKLLITGYSILITAILANLMANLLDIFTWYDLYKSITNTNIKATLKSLNIFSVLWLFFIYPLLLSIGYIVGCRIYQGLTL